MITVGQEIDKPGNNDCTSNRSKAPKLSFWQLWNMSFGFFGIQFGWGLQMANTSSIFEHLGARVHQLPLLWLAAPLTGLIVQPVIGYLSDHTWGPLGRRRPYFLAGAIAGSVALILMPNAPSLWMAVGLLWILDTSANISMTPFRSFVGDLLPEKQRTLGFTIQGIFHGLAGVIASALPWLLHHGFGVIESQENYHTVPMAVKLSFYIGALIFLGSVVWTVVTTTEPPPIEFDSAYPQTPQTDAKGMVSDIGIALREMPATMRQLAWVQFCSWFGMFCVFLYFPPAIAHNIFGATSEGTLLYTTGIEWAGLCIALYNAVCCIFSFVLPKLTQHISLKVTHSLCLICGAIGLCSLLLIHNQYALLLPMVGVGIAWASMLSLPYAMLINVLPVSKSGLYMGIFNFFIVLPEIVASLSLGWMMNHLFADNRLIAVVMGGVFMLGAALLTQRVQNSSDIEPLNHDYAPAEQLVSTH
ncbi:MFS transporter [Acaryochloris sp. IP29b_bin.137]|uniref:MFS transporter n=1 Tax=Acaryochloris sp. IP29b_bin.137 TaxID=2969217 RepID=UPI002615CE1E|nr:MFS transporter [Acaryochloris sp. IP29b_bin.137]